MFYNARVYKDGNQWTAKLIGLDGCATCAATREKVIDAAKDALNGWLEASLDHGQMVPEPVIRRGTVPIRVDPVIALAIELRRARLGAGLTQAEVAKRAGVAQQQVARLESGTGNPSISSLVRLADALGAHVDVLVSR